MRDRRDEPVGIDELQARQPAEAVNQQSRVLRNHRDEPAILVRDAQDAQLLFRRHGLADIFAQLKERLRLKDNGLLHGFTSVRQGGILAATIGSV